MGAARLPDGTKVPEQTPSPTCLCGSGSLVRYAPSARPCTKRAYRQGEGAPSAPPNSA